MARNSALHATTQHVLQSHLTATRWGDHCVANHPSWLVPSNTILHQSTSNASFDHSRFHTAPGCGLPTAIFGALSVDDTVAGVMVSALSRK